MANEENCCKDQSWKKASGCGPSGAVYGLGFLGAAFYFIQTATSFTDGLFGVLQAIVWPAILVYRFLEFFRL